MRLERLFCCASERLKDRLSWVLRENRSILLTPAGIMPITPSLRKRVAATLPESFFNSCVKSVSPLGSGIEKEPTEMLAEPEFSRLSDDTIAPAAANSSTLDSKNFILAALPCDIDKEISSPSAAAPLIAKVTPWNSTELVPLATIAPSGLAAFQILLALS